MRAVYIFRIRFFLVHWALDQLKGLNLHQQDFLGIPWLRHNSLASSINTPLERIHYSGVISGFVFMCINLMKRFSAKAHWQDSYFIRRHLHSSLHKVRESLHQLPNLIVALHAFPIPLLRPLPRWQAMEVQLLPA